MIGSNTVKKFGAFMYSVKENGNVRPEVMATRVWSDTSLN